MTSGGGPSGYCKKCKEYSQNRSIERSGLCFACECREKDKEKDKEK